MCLKHRILHASGFTAAERQQYTYLVHCNTVQTVVDVLQAMKQNGIPLTEPRAQVSSAHLSFFISR